MDNADSHTDGSAQESSAGASEPAISGATFFRLRSNFTNTAVTNADTFILDLSRSPLIGEIQRPSCVFRLYGTTERGRVPTFSAFLHQFPKYTNPAVEKYGYVVIAASIGSQPSFYAIAFGALGRFLLNNDFIDTESSVEIGRRETLTTEDGSAPQVLQVRSRRIGENSLRIQRKPSRPSSFALISLDPHFEIIDEVIGTPRAVEQFGKTLTAGHGLTVRRQLSLSQLSEVIANFESVLARANVESVNSAERMTSVKDVELVRQLDAELLRFFLNAKSLEAISFSIPDFVRLDDPVDVHFSKLGRGSAQFMDDVDVFTYRDELRRQGLLGEVTIEYLKTARIVIGDHGRSFSVYSCLTATVEHEGNTYVHDERSWYRIPSSIIQYINEQLETIEAYSGLPLPMSRLVEKEYNETVGVKDFLLLDRRLVAPAAGETRIEICDLLTITEHGARRFLDIIHVKRDFSSSTLSHLFAQGEISAVALGDRTTRDVLSIHVLNVLRRRKPKPAWSRKLPPLLQETFNPANVRIVYAILGDWKKKSLAERLPFFSKVTLVSAIQTLRGRGYEVAVAALQMDA